MLGLSEADRLPSVGLGVGASRSPSQSSGKLGNTYTAGLQVNAWEADFFGRIANLNETARAQLLSSTAGQRSAELSLAAALLATDLNLAADGQLLAITERSLASRRESLRLIQLREKVGAASVLELQAAHSLVAQAEVAQMQAARQRQLDLNALNLLAGAVVPAELLPPVPALPPDVMAATTSPSARSVVVAVILPAADAADAADPYGLGFAAVPAGLGSDVLLDRPDVVQAEMRGQAIG